MDQDSIAQEFQMKSNMVTPQILFSMYGKAEHYQKFVQFIFPHKISVSKTPDAPNFHTFECTDENGNQSFFHCIKFQEELDEYQIRRDFDYGGQLMSLKIRKIKDDIRKEKLKRTNTRTTFTQ
jgi:hypothetical protein